MSIRMKCRRGCKIDKDGNVLVCDACERRYSASMAKLYDELSAPETAAQFRAYAKPDPKPVVPRREPCSKGPNRFTRKRASTSF